MIFLFSAPWTFNFACISPWLSESLEQLSLTNVKKEEWSRMQKRLSAAYQRQNWCNCRCLIEAADMRGEQKTCHLWNGPSCFLNVPRACMPEKVVAWGRTHRVCSSVDQNRVRKFCSRNRLTLMFNRRYMRSRRTLSTLRQAFSTGAARPDG